MNNATLRTAEFVLPGHPDKLSDAIADAKTRAETLATLAAVDRAAMASDRKSFAALDADRRKAVLVAFE